MPFWIWWTSLHKPNQSEPYLKETITKVHSNQFKRVRVWCTIFGPGHQDQPHTDANLTQELVNAFYKSGVWLRFWTGRKTVVFLVLVDTKHICVSINAFAVSLLIFNQVNLRSLVLWVKWSQLLEEHFFSSYSATHLCVISLTSPAKKSLLLNKEKYWEKGGKKYSRVHFIWILMMLRNEQPWVKQKIYKTLSSFSM